MTEKKQKNKQKVLQIRKFVIPLQPQSRNKVSFARTVPWMSGLVSGLQNRVRRFESARNLKQTIKRVLSKLNKEWFLG